MCLLCPAVNNGTWCRAKQGPTASSSSPHHRSSHHSAGRAKHIAECHDSVPKGHAPTQQKVLGPLSSHGSLAGKSQQKPRLSEKRDSVPLQPPTGLRYHEQDCSSCCDGLLWGQIICVLPLPCLAALKQIHNYLGIALFSSS